MTTMPRCIYSLAKFESANGEHILQNSFGARWRSNSIVCNELQDEFSRTIDLALEKGLRPIRSLLGTCGGRGEPAPTIKNLQASSGDVYNLEPGFRARLRKPVVKVIEMPGGRRAAEMLLGSVKHQLDWALSILRREEPNLSVDEDALRAGARTVPLPDTTVRLDICLGGHDYFRGVLKSCFNLLAASYPTLPYESCFDAIRAFVGTGLGKPQQFIRWGTTSDPLNVPHLGPVDQAIFIVSRGSSVEGVVQFFGDIIHPFRLTDAYAGDPIRCAYIVDPFREARPPEMRHPEFSVAAIPVYADQSPEVTPCVMAAFRERVSRISEVCHDRLFQRILDETIQEVLGCHVGQPFTPEIASQLAARLTDRMAGFILPP